MSMSASAVSDLPTPARRGLDLLHDPWLNKGTAFDEYERDVLGLRGLLPPRVFSEAEQQVRVLENFRRISTDLEQYLYLAGLHDRNENLFFRVLIDNIEEMMPIVYTPTVGEACRRYGHIWRRSRGIYFSAEDAGRIDRVLANWPVDDVRLIVVTDGERILGLGDLGANGMGIPVGKLTLYTACAGIDPTQCLPVTLDVGTDNETLLDDPLYIGLDRQRLRGAPYARLVDEFVRAATRRYPEALIQFEDFSSANAFELLARYRDDVCCFNDDIQGTAAVAVAALLSAMGMTGERLDEQTLLFFGAGEASSGIAELVVDALVDGGMPEREARRRCWLFDSKGLVTAGRSGLAPHKRPFAHERAPAGSLIDAIRELRPTALIGASGQPRSFAREVIAEMAYMNERPIVFALSNPTSKSECTPQQAYDWSGGRAIFASGSPFAETVSHGRRFVPTQANNAYAFPGIGLGVVASRARRVTPPMFLAAARTLAGLACRADHSLGRLFPPLARIRDVSVEIAAAVCAVAIDSGESRLERRPDDLRAFARSHLYEPDYERLV